MKLIKSFILVLILSVIVAGNSYAGSSQASGESNFKAEEIIKFAKKFEKTLAAKGARVAIVARVGRPHPKLPEGISYTHTAIAVYSQITTSDGRKIPGYAIYNLYQRADEPDVSDLIIDYPVDFFAGVHTLEAGVVIPSPELQKRLLQVIGSKTYSELHNSKYSVIANPFTLDYQNCTEHTLDVITAAIYETNDITKIKANEKAYFQPQKVNVSPLTLLLGNLFVNEKAYFQPQKVNVSPLTLLLGNLFVADVATSDHPGSPETTTFTTIGNFLEKFEAASARFTIAAK